MAKAATPTSRKKSSRRSSPTNPRPNKRVDIELRRSQVEAYRMRGMTIREIASAFGVAPGTIENDLRAIREAHGERIRTMDDAVAKGETLSEFSVLMAEALTQFDLQDKGANKAQFLDKAIRTMSAKASFMLKSGIIEGAAAKGESAFHVHITSGEDIGSMNLLELRALEARLMGQLQDVEAVEVTSRPALPGG